MTEQQKIEALRKACELALMSLDELSPNVEDFSWGPTYELAKRRQQTAMRAINTALELTK